MSEKCLKIIIFTFDKHKHVKNVIPFIFKGLFKYINFSTVA